MRLRRPPIKVDLETELECEACWAMHDCPDLREAVLEITDELREKVQALEEYRLLLGLSRPREMQRYQEWVNAFQVRIGQLFFEACRRMQVRNIQHEQTHPILN